MRRPASKMTLTEDLVTVYTPESPLRQPTRLIGEMLADLVACRELAWRLFVRDVRAQHRSSLLGYFWVFLPPLVASLPFIYLNAAGVVRMGETPIPYAAYAVVGTIIWQTFVDALNSPLRTVTAARSMLTRINFPREAILLSGLMHVGFSFLVRLALLAVVFAAFSLKPAATTPLFFVGMMTVALTGFMIGLILTPIGVLYGDVQQGYSDRKHLPDAADAGALSSARFRASRQRRCLQSLDGRDHDYARLAHERDRGRCWRVRGRDGSDRHTPGARMGHVSPGAAASHCSSRQLSS